MIHWKLFLRVRTFEKKSSFWILFLNLEKSVTVIEVSVLQWQTSPNWKKFPKRKFFFESAYRTLKNNFQCIKSYCFIYTFIVWSQISGPGKKGFGVCPLKLWETERQRNKKLTFYNKVKGLSKRSSTSLYRRELEAT